MSRCTGQTSPAIASPASSCSTIGDGETVAAVFAALGFLPAFTYEKWRTEWADDTGHCVIDETPLGLFAELEGPEGSVFAAPGFFKPEGVVVFHVASNHLYKMTIEKDDEWKGKSK